MAHRPSPLAPALRGELCAKVGRCAEASRDFGEVLREIPDDSIDERALQRNLDSYLEHFPDRPFAREAHARLNALRAVP